MTNAILMKLTKFMYLHISANQKPVRVRSSGFSLNI